jgi:hypothetical protein
MKNLLSLITFLKTLAKVAENLKKNTLPLDKRHFDVYIRRVVGTGKS